MNFRKLAVLTAVTLTLVLGLMFGGVHRTRAAGPWFVDPAGNDLNDCLSAVTACKTIQAAVTKASSGDTITVAAGTYTENVSLTKSLTLKGAQAGVDARGRAASESTVMPAAPGTATFNIAVAGTYAIDGFSFSGGPTGSNGVIFTSAGPHDNLRIVNNRFSNYPSAAVWMNRGGIDITIDKNVMDGSNIASASTAQAIFMNGPQTYAGINITNNQIVNNKNRYGVFVDGNHNVGESATRAPSISGNVFDNNLQGLNLGSRSFGTNAAPVTGPYGGTISNNTFSNDAANGIQAGIQHVLVSGNKFTNNAGSGLVLTSFSSLVADRGAQNSTITCNLFTGNGSEGIFLSSAQAAGSMATNAVNQNNISGNVVGLTYNGTEAVDARNNWWGNVTGPTIASNVGGTGDKITNGPGNLLYSPFLTATSPCAPAPPDNTPPTVVFVNSVPSVGMIGTNVTLSSQANDPSGVTDIYYNLFTPGGTFVCNLAHVSISGSPTSYTDAGTLVAAPMPFAGLDTGVGGPCPAAGIAEGSYVLAANWIDGVGNQVGAPNNQVLSNYQASATFSPFIFDKTPPVVTPPGTVTLYTGSGATTCDVTVADLDLTLGTATATDNLTGVVGIVRSGVPAGNVFPVGSTTVTYTATDGAGNTASANQTVNVVDNTAPAITLIGANPLFIPYGSVFTDPGATALDNCAGNLTSSIVATGAVNTFVIGTYTRTYKVSDGSNTAVTTRTVKVVPNPPTNKDQCKGDGWKTLTRADGSIFKNQGDCVSYMSNGK